jgi:hypothetical protein
VETQLGKFLIHIRNRDFRYYDLGEASSDGLMLCTAKEARAERVEDVKIRTAQLERRATALGPITMNVVITLS